MDQGPACSWSARHLGLRPAEPQPALVRLDSVAGTLAALGMEEAEGRLGAHVDLNREARLLQRAHPARAALQRWPRPRRWPDDCTGAAAATRSGWTGSTTNSPCSANNASIQARKARAGERSGRQHSRSRARARVGLGQPFELRGESDLQRGVHRRTQLPGRPRSADRNPGPRPPEPGRTPPSRSGGGGPWRSRRSRGPRPWSQNTGTQGGAGLALQGSGVHDGRGRLVDRVQRPSEEPRPAVP